MTSIRQIGEMTEMRKFEDISGQRFGKLVAVECLGKDKHNNYLWLCKCDCGNTTNVTKTDLQRGHSKSCGCRKNGKGSRRLYNVWRTMKRRCEDKNHKSYCYYGALGIEVCEEWKDYLVFKEWALSNGYDKDAPHGKCTLDRINPYKNYEPQNCRWVTMADQNKNKRVRYKSIIEADRSEE